MQPQPTLADLESVYYEAHKDAYGWRDRSDRSHWSVADYERAIDRCCRQMDEDHWEEGVRMFEAACAFHSEIHALRQLGAPDHATAVRWWFNANGLQSVFEEPYGQDYEHVLWGRGFPMRMWKGILKSIGVQPSF